MSKLFKTEKRGSLANAVANVNTTLQEQVGTYSKSLAGQVASMEGLAFDDLTAFQVVAETTGQHVSAALEELALTDDSKWPELVKRRNQASLEAATIVMMASGAPVDYLSRARSAKVSGDDTHMLVDPLNSGLHAGMGYSAKSAVSMESFDENELRRHVGYSTVYAAVTARQADFAEAFFPTHVVSPDQVGVDIKVRRNMVLNQYNRGISGEEAQLGKRNLLEAFRDHTILENESTLIIPVVRDDSKDHFVDPALVPIKTVANEGHDVDTAPLLFDITHDLLGISQTDTMLAAGVVDQTDSVDAHARLSTIYFKIGASVVAIDTKRNPLSGFTKTIENDSREMQVQFRSKELLLSGDTKDVKGADVPALKALGDAGYYLRFAIRVDGSLNVEYGNINLYTNKATFVALFDKNNNRISMTDPAAKAILDALAIEPIGYDVFARRSNTNRRHRGLLVDVTEFAERYTVPLSSPISTVAPLATDKSAKDLQALIAASNIRTNNNAVTLLMNYADTLQAATQTDFDEYSLTTVPGIGRLLVFPTFEYKKIDMLAEVNSVQSAQRAEDIQGVLTTTMREMAYRMVRDSNYQAALDASGEGSGERPHLIVGTDIVTQQFLMITGDDRTLSIGMDHTIVATPDARIANRIYMSFVRQNQDEPDALSFGAHIYIPELTSVVPVTRHGNVTRETMVQMRNLHVTNLPIMGLIEIENLDKVVTSRTALDVNSKVVQEFPGGDDTAPTDPGTGLPPVTTPGGTDPGTTP